jgi:hypothetical protein
MAKLMSAAFDANRSFDRIFKAHKKALYILRTGTKSYYCLKTWLPLFLEKKLILTIVKMIYAI